MSKFIDFIKRIRGIEKRAPTPPPAPKSSFDVSDDELRKRLQTIVQRERLVVLPRTTQMWSTNDSAYGEDLAGRYNLKTRIIELLPKYFLCPWVLAHEIGHHIAITYNNDRSESAADSTGHEIILGLLSPEERKTMMYKINIHLPKK